jgi:hypothetical protein
VISGCFALRINLFRWQFWCKGFVFTPGRKLKMNEQGSYVDKILETLAARLNVLELQSAAYGLDTPPHIVTEIEGLKEKIEETRMASKSIISVQLLANMEPNERWKRLYDAIWEVEILLYTLQKNSESDRTRIQNRHTEFNISLQRNIIETEYYRRIVRVLFAATFLAYVLIGALYYML